MAAHPSRIDPPTERAVRDFLRRIASRYPSPARGSMEAERAATPTNSATPIWRSFSKGLAETR